jgi:hypothetical protein
MTEPAPRWLRTSTTGVEPGRSTASRAADDAVAESDITTSFITTGLVVLGPEALGIAPERHEQILAAQRALLAARAPISTQSVPSVLEVLRAPGLITTLNRLVGPDCAIVPFTHNAPFLSGAFDQHWHKDDNGPYNARWPRHHHPIQLELLYFPQAVLPEMGPTAVLPGSHYWTFDHEDNHDNFAGADHLDFNYQLTGMEHVPVSGPRSRYDPEAIQSATTEHDIRMREAPLATGWPLMQQFEVAPLAAGSVVIYSHNLFHRGNHRRDPFADWKARPRFMWRFWLYRTHDPQPIDAGAVPWRAPARDACTGLDLMPAHPMLDAVWSHHAHWLHGAPTPRRACSIDTARAALRASGEAAEPTRIDAAYRLAAAEDAHAGLQCLGAALRDERESVRRAATVGLIAAGDSATPVLLSVIESERKWLRRAAVTALGDAADLTTTVLAALAARLERDASVYVRSCAAHALGCLARRALARGIGIEHVPTCAALLCASLEREGDRLSMDRVQNRSIKFVRPTDASDVCEGIGITYRQTRFEPVRSAVRENALAALVIMASHGPETFGPTLSTVVAQLGRVITQDRNVFSVGFAMDALNRLAERGLKQAAAASDPTAEVPSDVLALFDSVPIKCLESLQQGGGNWADTARADSSYSHF